MTRLLATVTSLHQDANRHRSDNQQDDAKENRVGQVACMGFHGRSPVISSAFLRPVSRHGAVNNQIFIGYSLNLKKVIAPVRMLSQAS